MASIAVSVFGDQLKAIVCICCVKEYAVCIGLRVCISRISYHANFRKY